MPLRAHQKIRINWSACRKMSRPLSSVSFDIVTFRYALLK
jgi:hypothetical protein